MFSTNNDSLGVYERISAYYIIVEGWIGQVHPGTFKGLKLILTRKKSFLI